MKPKQFDPEKTLEVIAETFARSGYEGTSLDDIIKSTGLGKQSLYNAFGDKKSMVKKSIECFGKNKYLSSPICDKELSGRERIEGFFEKAFQDTQCEGYSGCLITNMLLEKGTSDPEVAKALSQRWNSTRALLQEAFEAGVKDKSIKSKQDPEIVSYALMTVMNGLRVAVQASDDPEKIKKVLKLNLQSLL